MATAIDADVLELLRSGVVCEGAGLRITRQIDRKLYVAANAVLEALGGKWVRGAKAHIFREDAAPLIADVVATGEYVNERKENEFFPTPLAVWREMEAYCFRVDRALEPSAGDGAIARYLVEYCDELLCVEKFEPRAKQLAAALVDRKGVDFWTEDFLAMKPGEVRPFGLVAMNPPFSRGQDMAHVRHAFDFLVPGGRLIAVTSPGWTFRSDKKAVEFREWAKSVEAEWTPLPDGAFKESGTGVRTGLFVADAPASCGGPGA